MENEKEKLLKLKEQLTKLTEKELKERDLNLRKIALNKLSSQMTGYPSIDKPWLKYYNEEHILAPLPNMTIYDYVKKRNADNLDNLAFKNINGKSYTYREFFEEVNKLSISLQKLGVKKGDTILGSFIPLAEEAFLLYAADNIGAIISFFVPNTPVEEICKFIDMFDVKYYFTFADFIDENSEKYIYDNTKLNNIIKYSILPMKSNNRTMSWEDFREYGKYSEYKTIKKDPKEALFIAKTGGSTGVPKNVLLSDNGFNVVAHQYINSVLDYNKGDNWLRLWPLFSATASIASCHVPLSIGMVNTIRAIPDLEYFDNLILQEKPNHLTLVPVLLQSLQRSKKLDGVDFSYIKTSGCGGTAMTEEFEKDVYKFYDEHNIDTFIGGGYGLTENSSTSAFRMSKETAKIGFSGVPMVDNVFAAFDPDTLEEKKYNEEGEICICSPTNMIGYYNEEEQTRESLKTHPDGKVWLHTGDLGYITEDGLIKINGRMTRNIFLFSADKVYPDALENLISKVEGVVDVSVVSGPDKEHEGFFVPICFVIIDNEYDELIIKNKINKLCSEAFPEYARPRDILFKNNFPRTPIGKVDFKELEKELANQHKLQRIKK